MLFSCTDSLAPSSFRPFCCLGVGFKLGISAFWVSGFLLPGSAFFNVKPGFFSGSAALVGGSAFLEPAAPQVFWGFAGSVGLVGAGFGSGFLRGSS